jgi:hypothetical protein
MGLVEKIYDNSPVFSQNIMVSVSGYQRNITRYGKAYYDYLLKLRTSIISMHLENSI